MIFLRLYDLQSADLLSPSIKDSEDPSERAVADERLGFVAVPEDFAPLELVMG